ncbi:MAG: hypothetical protein H6586_08860 [Flavobacteriales bacterium]|nr:hypothetical protein [Flavobacteriales bacterium]
MSLDTKNSIAIPCILNTSNQGKLKEFQSLFAKFQHQMTNTNDDLDEADADPITVIVQKASAVNHGHGGVIVEDTSLDIDGEDVGVNIRWLLSNLSQFEGKKATWRVLLAFREKNLVFIAQGIVHGTIVNPKGNNGFGFDPFFLPNGTNTTLAQNKPEEFNARAKAVENLMKHNFFAIKPAIDNWDGPMQHSD